MSEVLQHGNTVLKCPECDSNEITEIKHLESVYDSMIDIALNFGMGFMANKCMKCKCIFKD